MLTVAELKSYIHIDYNDDDGYLSHVVEQAGQIVAGVARRPWSQLEAEGDEAVYGAQVYAAAYLAEHREDADMALLVRNVRAVLEASGNREAKF